MEEEIEYTRRVEFDGVWYEVTTTLGCEENDELMVEVEAEESGERWTGCFSSSYIESLTSKTGNYKRASTFARMVVSAVEGSAESVYVDLLTSSDLEALRRRREAAPPVVVNGNLKNTKHSTRRYLIVTYAVEFDKVHYPLPLDVESDPSLLSLKRQVKRAKKKIKSLIEDTRKPDNSPVAALKAQVIGLRRQREVDRNEIISLRRRLTLLSSQRRSPKPAPLKSSRPPPSVASSRSSTSTRGRSPGRGPPGSRFDPTAYARARAEKLAAAKNRRSAWGSPQASYSDNGYSSAGGYSSGDSRRSVGSYASSTTRRSRASTSKRATTSENIHSRKQYRPNTASSSTFSSRAQPSLEMNPSLSNKNRPRQPSPRAYFRDRDTTRHYRAPTTTQRREPSPRRAPTPPRRAPHTTIHNNAPNSASRCCWKHRDDKENVVMKPLATTKSFHCMKATTHSQPFPLHENVSGINLVSEGEPKKSTDIGDIDRRLNALQAFLKEAKGQRAHDAA